MRRSGLGSLSLLLLATSVRAQIYSFVGDPVPGNRSLHTLYAFYVYALDEAPERTFGKPFIKFSGLKCAASVSVAQEAAQAYEKYDGIQLSIMRYRDFWDLIDPKNFCATTTDVEHMRSEKKDQLLVRKKPTQKYADVSVYAHTLPFTASPQKDVREYITKTGVYILVFSNCGALSDATVTGNVIVKNAYGFLPGNEYHKMPFYGWLLLVYILLALGWMALSMMWWKELFAIQHCISFVILCGLFECFLWYVFFNDWNSSGNRGKFLFVLAILATVVKSTFSYMLVLVASLGWGVTRPYLDSQVLMKIQVLSFFYIVLDFIREAVLSFRNSHSLSIAFVLLCLLPVSLLNGAIFSWVFTALSNLMETLKERRQFEKLLLFQRLWKLLIFALTCATLTLLFQIFNLSRSLTARWKYQWMLTDGISHFLFLVVLGAMMYLWAPHKNSQRYAYSQQVGADHDAEKDAADTPGAIWADEDGLDDGDEGETFWASTKGSSAFEVDATQVTSKAKGDAEVIGVSSIAERS